MTKSFYGALFKFSRFIVQFVIKKYSTKTCYIGEGATVYISHHRNLFGPFMTLNSFPIDLHCWVLHVFLDKKACYHQYRDYTFSKRYGWNKWVATGLSYICSRFVTALLKSGKCIPVYRGTRSILQTFKLTVDLLKKNESIVIFPNVDYTNTSSKVGELYEGFLYLEKYYYKETGNHVRFVPLYASKSKKSFFTGEPVTFREGEPFKKERKVVIEKIQTELNQLAERTEV